MNSHTAIRATPSRSLAAHQHLMHLLRNDQHHINTYHRTLARFLSGLISPSEFSRFCAKSLPSHAIPVHNQLILAILSAAVSAIDMKPPVKHPDLFRPPDQDDFFAQLNDPARSLEIHCLPIPLPKKRRFYESPDGRRTRLRHLAMALPQEDRERLRRAVMALEDHPDSSSSLTSTKRARKRTKKPTQHAPNLESMDRTFVAIDRVSQLQGFGAGVFNGYTSFHLNSPQASNPILSKPTRYQEYLRLCTTPTCAAHRDLPTPAHLFDRVKAMCWEAGLELVPEEQVVEFLILGLYTYLKTIVHAMIHVVPGKTTAPGLLTLAHLACAVLVEPVIANASLHVPDRVIPRLWHFESLDFDVALAKQDWLRRVEQRSILEMRDLRLGVECGATKDADDSGIVALT